MSKELKCEYSSDFTLKAVVFNGADEVWYPGSSAFEAWGTSARDRDDYKITVTHRGGSRQSGDMPAADAGQYSYHITVENDNVSTDADEVVWTGNIVWNGTAQITEADLALIDIKLDHLISLAAAEDEVADNSIIARLAATEGDWSEFNDETDSLEAIRDKQTEYVALYPFAIMYTSMKMATR